jgi:outer membrane immunogenic protein
MSKRLLISCSFICLTICTAQADDKLDAAMKRIAELEAKNQALEQSNKEKDALLKKQHVQISGVQVKSSSFKQKTSSVTRLVTSAAETDTKPDVDISNTLGGAYIGIGGGYGGGDFDYRSLGTFASEEWLRGVHNVYRAGGAIAGGQIGYNFITSNRYFIGGEFDFNWVDINAKRNIGSDYASLTNDPDNTVYTDKERIGARWIGTTRARIGYQFKEFLPYLTGGIAFGESVYQVNTGLYQIYGKKPYFNLNKIAGSGSQINVGWAAGAGVEIPVFNNFSLKTEYLYTQFGGPRFNSGALTFYNSGISKDLAWGSSSALGIHQIRFGINYHPHFFDQPAPAIASKY